MLLQISQQIASITPQVPIASTPPPPYPAFRPTDSAVRVNICWVTGLVCGLSAALLATVVQAWVRSYMQVFQQYDHPLKRARFRQFFFEGASGMRTLAAAVLRLIQLSLFFFFVGLGDSMINNNIAIGVTTIIPICLCGSFYLYSVLAPLWKLQSPHQNLLSRLFFLIRTFQRSCFGTRFPPTQRMSTTVEEYQEELVMGETEERKDRDVRAIRWLVDKTAATGDMEPLVLAIPGAFNTEWGREVWTDVSCTPRLKADRFSASSPDSLMRSPYPIEGTTIDSICRCVRYLFETCNNHSYFQNEEARRRRLRACVNAAASLVCFTRFRLEWLGEVCKLISEISHIEKINGQPTPSDLSFIIPCTCLSLVTVPQILNNNQVRVLADLAVGGLARLRLESGRADEAAQKNARMIDTCLEEVGSTSTIYVGHSSPRGRRGPGNKSKRSYKPTNRRFRSWSASEWKQASWRMLTGGSRFYKVRWTKPVTG